MNTPDAPRVKPHSAKRRNVMLAILGIALMVAGVWLYGAIPDIQRGYYRRMMNRGWEETYSQTPTVDSGFSGITLGEAWERYEYARNELVRLGELKFVNYQFRHLRTSTRELRHLSRGMMEDDNDATKYNPPSVYWTMTYNPDQLDLVRIWGEPDKVDSLMRELTARDVPDYFVRYLRPAVLKETDEKVAAWSNLGMWLPDQKDVEFFREHYDITRDALKRALDDPKIGRAACSVIQDLKLTATDLGPELLSLLQAEPEGAANSSLVRSLAAVQYRPPECLAELQRRWLSLQESPNEALFIAAAIWVLTENPEEKSSSLGYILKRLAPVSADLTPGERTAYLDTQWNAVVCLNAAPGCTAAIPSLEKLLEIPAKA